MHIEIDAECRRGLRIIEEIPDIALCKIEGYNGIGKTSAIRLLQLCVGDQPFAGNNAAWRSFRNQLVRARVRITSLQEVHQLEWILTPDKWPEIRAEPLGSNAGSIFIDGRRAQMKDVRELLQVHHLNTTETPVNVLIERTTAAGSTIEQWYSKNGEPRGIQLDEILGNALTYLAASSTSEVRLAREIAHSAHVAAKNLAERSAWASMRVQLLAHAVEVADQLDTVRGSSPQMRNRLQELEERLKEADLRKERLNREITEEHVKQQLGEQAGQNFERAEKLVARHDLGLRKATAALEQAAAIGRVDPTRQAVASAIRIVEKELDDLVKAEPLLTTEPQLLAILNDLSRRLDDAVAVDLGNNTLLDADDIRSAWTVVDLRDACRSQMDRLVDRRRGTDAELIARQITAARQRLDALARMEMLFDSVAQAKIRLGNAERKQIEAAAGLPGKSENRLNTLVTERNDLDQEERDLQSRIDRLRAEIELLGGGSTEEALAAELDRLCREADVDPTRVRGSFERERLELNNLSQEKAQAQMKEVSATRDLDTRIFAVEETVKRLATSDDLGWLRRAMPVMGHLEELEFDQKLDELDKAQKLLSNERDIVASTISAVRGIGGALHELAERLSDRNAIGKKSQTWTMPVAQWLGEEARQWFNDEIIRENLFDGGRNIRLDPDQLAVSWVHEGVTMDRPLTAFSSGQQAFAFTRARVAQLDRDIDQAANRLIALDEFGAYMDAQRFAGLVDYLVQRQERIPNDHILVILPCGLRPHDTAGNSATQALHDLELARRGYFAEALRP